MEYIASCVYFFKAISYLSCRVEHYCLESVDQVQHTTDTTIQRLLTELEMGGNIRFEDGKPTDMW